MTDRAERQPGRAYYGHYGKDGEIVPSAPLPERQVGELLSEQATYAFEHPHEPEIPRVVDAEGRCLVCRLLIEKDALARQLAEAERRMKHCSEVLQSLVIDAEEYEEAAGDGPDLSGVIANVAKSLIANPPDPPASPAEGSEA